jgi:hypothetical protein
MTTKILVGSASSDHILATRGNVISAAWGAVNIWQWNGGHYGRCLRLAANFRNQNILTIKTKEQARTETDV